jgi:hypothetical protein
MQLARRTLLAGALAAPAVLALVIGAAAAGQRTILVPASRRGFPGWLAGPYAGIGGHGLTADQLAKLLLAMLACYLLVLLWARDVPASWALAAIGAAHVVALLAPPLLSADVFGYIGYARLGAVHGLDPYTHGAAALAGDPVRPFIRWKDVTSPYGPLFTIGSYALAPLGVPTALWALKAIAAGASLACVGIVARTARRLGRSAVSAALFVGLNPLLLVYGVAGAHNDMLLAAVGTAAVAAAVAGRERAGGAIGAAAVALKPSAALLAAFLVVGVRRRSTALAGAVAMGAVLLVVAVVAFDRHAIGFANALQGQQRFVSLHSVPNEVGRLLGAGGITPAIRAVADAALAVAVAVLLARAWRGRDWIAMAGWATLALLLATAWLLPWYVVWLLPLAALAERPALRAATLALCAFVIATRAPFLLA